MSYVFWILVSFIAVFMALNIVGFCKKIPILAKISSVFILPLVGILNISFLKDLLPDSFHVIFITVIAYTFLTISQVLHIFETKNTFIILSRFFFVMTIITWCHLYFSVFYIYRVPLYLTIFLGFLSLIVSAVNCIFIGRQKLHIYISTIAGIIVTSFLFYLTFVFFIHKKTTSTILLNAGTLITIALVVFYSLDFLKYHSKLGKPIKLFLLIAAQTLISFSNILMLQ